MIAPRVAALVSSGFGSGYAPKAPGTVGTAAAAAVWIGLSWLGLLSSTSHQIVLALITIVVGTLASKISLDEEGGEDPQWIVIDEWAGLFVALIGTDSSNLFHIALAFIGFRLFDITKPGPIGKVEELPGAFGIMADDVVAGACALVGLMVLRAF